MSTHTVDHDTGEIIEPETSREITTVVPTPAPALAVTPQVKAGELVERLSVIKDAMTTAMLDGIDYGRIPGVDKPTLLKPGAEKLGVLFQLDVQLANEKTWGPGDHLTVVSRATVFHAPTGARLGYGEGVCTTRESKYAYRTAQRVCPDCGHPSVIKGRDEYGGGWLCFKKTGGCGHKWPDGTSVIEGQETGKVENTELPDLWNTVVKMAEKRARVDAVLAVTGASALFTQDLDDEPGPAQRHAPETPTVTAEPAAPTERVASAKQRGLIHARAAERNMSSADLANTILVVAGQQPREYDSDEHAGQMLARLTDRLPARLVDAVLTAIADHDSEILL